MGNLESIIAKALKSKASEAGVDPALISESDVHVESAGRTVNVEYGGASVSLPAPSQSALDEWFAENGKVIAGSLLTLAAVVVGAAIAKN